MKHVRLYEKYDELTDLDDLGVFGRERIVMMLYFRNPKTALGAPVHNTDWQFLARIALKTHGRTDVEAARKAIEEKEWEYETVQWAFADSAIAYCARKSDADLWLEGWKKAGID